MYITAPVLDNILPADIRNRATAAQRTQVIASASAEVDGYLRSAGYALPLLTWDAAITEHTGAIAAYRLAVATGLLKADSLKDSTLYANYQAALSYLKNVVDGVVRPSLVDSGTTTPGRTPLIGAQPKRGW